MARSLEQIQTEMKTAIRTYASLNSFLFPEEGGSKYSVFNVIIYVVAAAMFTLETMIDVLKSDIQRIADSAPSGNAKWLQAQILRFQFGDVIQLVDFVPTYSVIDATKRIVARCSVRSLASGIIAIKVARDVGGVIQPLTNAQLLALKDYYYGSSSTQGIGFAGVSASFINLPPDKIRIQGKIYFYGQYIEATVKANVIAAIESFLATFQNDSFDGTVFMIRLIDAVQAVPGVSRFVLEDVKARPDSVALAGANAVDLQGYYTTVAGYLVSETTAGNTLNDTITISEENV